MDTRKEEKNIRASALKFAEDIIKRIPPAFFIYPSTFAAAFLLARSIILGSASPFGLAASAIVSRKRGSVFGLLGATFGYLSIMDSINSLKYIACIILIFTAHFVFSDTSISKSRVFSPLAVIIPSACINLVFLADAAFPLYDCALALLEISLATLCTILFSYISDRRIGNALFPIGLLALCASFISSLSGFTLLGYFSFGRILAFALVLLCAYTGGINAGAITGTVFGFAVSITESSPEFCMLYAILGIISAAIPSKNKFIPCAIAIVFTIFISVCINPASLASISVELIFASVLFVPFANLFSRHMRKFLISTTPNHDLHIRSYAVKKLNLAANAFRSLNNMLSETRLVASPPSISDEKAAFQRISSVLCKKCTLSHICWKRDFESTRDAMTKAQAAIRENGFLSAKDFPIHFSSRCIHIENFVNSINREIFSVRTHKKFSRKLSESRELLTKQYYDASAIFSAISSDISDSSRFDEEAENKLRDFLYSLGILCDIAVYRDSRNHINIHLCGKDLERIANDFKTFEPDFRKIAGTALNAPQYTHGENLDDIILRETPPLRAIFGAAVKQMNGNIISGDSGSFFQPSNGCIALLLSDGMGSGKAAAKESALSIKLLEDLLKSDIPPKNALETLQNALMLKAEYTDVFATLDLMYADMFTGSCEFYKLGAAPTYIKRGRQIRRITSSSLPAGIKTNNIPSPDRTTLTLSEGDFIVMASDGICDESDDLKFMDFLSKSDETSPKALADALFAFSLSTYGKKDDMTVAVVRILPEV